MKKLLFFSGLACLLFFFVSCSDNKTDSPSGSIANPTDSSTTSMAEVNTANTRKIFMGIETGDMSMMDSIVSSDVVDHTPMGDVKGLDSVKKMLGDMHNHISNLKMDILADATGGDYHFVLVRMTGKTKDNMMMGMPANTAIDHTTVGVARMTNGKAVEHWSFMDPKEMMQMPKAAAHK